MDFEKECEICGQYFTAKTKAAKYCPECRKNSDRKKQSIEYAQKRAERLDWALRQPETVICKQCGKEFKTLSGWNFCSKNCLDEHRKRSLCCEVCGANLYELGITDKLICSEKCRLKKDAILEAKKIARAKENNTYIACANCGKMFISQNYSNICCCNSCRLEYSRKKAADAEKERSSEEYKKKFAEAKQKRLEARALEKKRKLQKEKAAAIEYSKTHSLCINCRTSQFDCERFTSKFRYSPKDCKMKRVDGTLIVYKCPKYKK